MKQIIRKVIRSIFKVKENETVEDGLKRVKSKILRIFYKQKYNVDDLKKSLVELGIKKGDNVMVHCAYREFYNFTSTPKSIIELLYELVGEEGTVLMPCYGGNIRCFDVKNDKSAAGVLSENFRKQPGVLRSECSNFSVCAYGKSADAFTKLHYKSCYGFDEFSPYYLFAKSENSKILMLGLGKYPVKNTVFHIAGYLLKGNLPSFRRLLTERYEAIVIDSQGKKRVKQMITRDAKYKNSSRKMKKMFRKIPANKRGYIKISNLDIVLYDAQAALKTSIDAAMDGFTIYKNLY